MLIWIVILIIHVLLSFTSFEVGSHSVFRKTTFLQRYSLFYYFILYTYHTHIRALNNLLILYEIKELKTVSTYVTKLFLLRVNPIRKMSKSSYLNNSWFIEKIVTHSLEAFHVFQYFCNSDILSVHDTECRHIDKVVLEVLKIKSFDILRTSLCAF